MEQVIDWLIQELDDLRQESEFFEAIEVYTEPKFDDPGLVTVNEYPYMYVAPVLEEPFSETMGLAGYDVRRLTIQIGVVVNAADYFDPLVNEMPGSRQLVKASGLIRKRLRRLSKRGLDGTARNLVVANTNYVPDLRDNVFVRLAVTTLTVEKQYQHEE